MSAAQLSAFHSLFLCLLKLADCHTAQQASPALFQPASPKAAGKLPGELTGAGSAPLLCLVALGSSPIAPTEAAEPFPGAAGGGSPWELLSAGRADLWGQLLGSELQDSSELLVSRAGALRVPPPCAVVNILIDCMCRGPARRDWLFINNHLDRSLCLESRGFGRGFSPTS